MTLPRLLIATEFLYLLLIILLVCYIHTKLSFDYYNSTGNVDYQSGPYNITFLAGEIYASFYIKITDDRITEGNEAFHLNIDPVSLSGDLVYGLLGGAVVTIMDDDSKYMCVYNYMCIFYNAKYMNLYTFSKVVC